MRHSRTPRGVSIAIVLLILFASVSSSLSETQPGPRVRWNEIIGSAANGLNIGGIMSVGIWTAQDGRANVNLDSGEVSFFVRGLVLAQSAARVVAGTTGEVSQVKGTLVCNGRFLNDQSQSVLVDTDSVPIDAQGDARFRGNVTVPPECKNSEYLAFLIRVAVAESPFLLDKFIGVGVERVP